MSPEEHPRFGFIDGPAHTTTKRRIDFFYDYDPELPFEESEEIKRTRQRFIKARYGDAAFEEAPILEPYTEYDFLGIAAELKDSQKLPVSLFLDQNEANCKRRHYIRRRPYCPGCRPSRAAAEASLISIMVRDNNRIPRDPHDDELNWDTETVVEDTSVPQPDLYLDIAGLEQLTPPKDLIEGIIPRRGVGYITGRDRSLKTFLALDIALNTAFMMPYWHYATPLHAHQRRAVRRKNQFYGMGKIIFAAGEGVHAFLPRINAWIEAQHVQHYGAPGVTTADGLPSVRKEDCDQCKREDHPDVGHVHHIELAGDADPTPFYVPGIGPLERENLTVRNGVVNLHRAGHDYLYLLAKARAEKPDLIVIDTLALASGSADQQAATDMGQVHESARRLAEASDGVVILIAHTDKGDHDARGSSVIEDNADFVLHCVREEHDLLEVEVSKRKDAEDGWKFAMGVTEVELGLGTSLILHDYEGNHYNLDATEEEALDFRDRFIKALARHKVNDLLWDQIQMFLPTGPRGGQPRDAAVDTAIERAENAGIIEVANPGGGAGNKKRWRLTRSQVEGLKHVNNPMYRQLTGNDTPPE